MGLKNNKKKNGKYCNLVVLTVVKFIVNDDFILAVI